MIIAVGSTNVTKIRAVELASAQLKAKVVGVDVPSGVSPQPMSDVETRKGAENRAHDALTKIAKAEIGVGLEGGVQEGSGELLDSVWCCVVDRKGNTFFSSGLRFPIPPIIASKIRNGGEMGPIMDEITGKKGTKHGAGMIGIISKNYIDRTAAYSHIAMIAIGQWYGRDWEKEL